MPANLTPEYKAAEAAFRRARDPEERLGWLREMLRTIPKHKGTDHLQADIRTRIKELTEALAGPKKGGARRAPATVVRPEGAAQVALLGPPNAGKSQLHARLTGSHAQAGPYPFTTQLPLPGMLEYEDVGIQLVDLPSVSREHSFPWLANALQPADACLLVVDLSAVGCVEEVLDLHELLEERRVVLTAAWGEAAGGKDGADGDPFEKRLPALAIFTKADAISDVAGELAVFRELAGVPYPAVVVSAETGEGIDRIGRELFERLGIVRVYTKVPGGQADLGRPFTVRAGETVHDVAMLVHRDIAASLRYARLWGEGHFDGQQVGRDHVVADGDIVELHA